MKHSITNRPQAIFIRDRHVGCLQQTPKGYDAYDTGMAKIGAYPSAATAVTYLRDRASPQMETQTHSDLVIWALSSYRRPAALKQSHTLPTAIAPWRRSRPDADWPELYRVRLPNGDLTDMVNRFVG
jgi:hypothetical protein